MHLARDKNRACLKIVAYKIILNYLPRYLLKSKLKFVCKIYELGDPENRTTFHFSCPSSFCFFEFSLTSGNDAL